MSWSWLYIYFMKGTHNKRTMKVSSTKLVNHKNHLLWLYRDWSAVLSFWPLQVIYRFEAIKRHVYHRKVWLRAADALQPSLFWNRRLFPRFYGFYSTATKKFLDANVLRVVGNDDEGCAETLLFTKSLFILKCNLSYASFHTLPKDYKYNSRRSARTILFLSFLYVFIFKITVCTLHLVNAVLATVEPIDIGSIGTTWVVLTPVRITWIDWFNSLLHLGLSLKFEIGIKLAWKNVSSSCCKPLLWLRLVCGDIIMKFFYFLSSCSYKLRKLKSVWTEKFRIRWNYW